MEQATVGLSPIDPRGQVIQPANDGIQRLGNKSYYAIHRKGTFLADAAIHSSNQQSLVLE